MLLPIIVISINSALALDNGLGLTPPMGWLSWERFRCNVDCANDPLNCISERLIAEQAEAMVAKGFKAAGYEYVIIDDCWLDKERGGDGELRPDPERFPSGIKALADYVHSLGLKFGIYQDIGSHTCAGYPGLRGHLQQDAKTLAGWGVDYLKIDGCNINETEIPQQFTEFGKYLKETGRKIFYECEWVNYIYEGKRNYADLAKNCNMGRLYNDIQDSWNDVLNITDYVAQNQDTFARFAGPGYWNDPDMLIIGNFGLSATQARAQMALWSVLSAPLIMSTDLRSIRERDAKILMNKGAIEINQDPLGHQGRRVVHNEKRKVDIFVKPLSPRHRNATSPSAAVAVLYRGTSGTPNKVSFTLESLGLNGKDVYEVEEVFSAAKMGEIKSKQRMTVKVDPTGVAFLRLDARPRGDFQLYDDEEEDVMEEAIGDGDGTMGDDLVDAVLVENPGETGWKGETTNKMETLFAKQDQMLNETKYYEEEIPDIVIIN